MHPWYINMIHVLSIYKYSCDVNNLEMHLPFKPKFVMFCELRFLQKKIAFTRVSYGAFLTVFWRKQSYYKNHRLYFFSDTTRARASMFSPIMSVWNGGTLARRRGNIIHSTTMRLSALPIPVENGSLSTTTWKLMRVCTYIPVCGSGHEDAAVLLPGFAINW